MSQHALLLSSLIALCAVGPLALAAEVPDLSASSALDAGGPLSLIEAVRVGVTRNLALMGERTLLEREQARRRGAWQTYSPTLNLRAGLFRDRPLGLEPPPSLLTYAAGVSWYSPVGTVLSAEATMGHPVLGAAGAENQGALALGVSQPLLKDGWLAGAALPLRESELSAALQRALFRAALNLHIFEVETAYWDLAVAEADVVIKTRSRDRARQQSEDTEENIRRGILAPAEIYIVQENVVFFEQELLQARQNLEAARRRLTRLLAVEATAVLAPSDPLEKPAFTVAAAEAIVSAGLRANPRLQAQRLRHELATVRERYARNQALPTLDLAASLSLQGAGASYGGALGEVVADGTPRAQVGLIFALPLDRGAIGANRQTAVLETRRQAIALDDEEQLLRHQVLDGVSELRTNLELLTLTEQQLGLAELKLQAETEKYQNGISTLADVVRFQRELDNASIRLQRMIRAVLVGRSRLLVQQGTLHEAFGIELQ